VAVVGWAAQMGTITFHPWPCATRTSTIPDELRLDLDRSRARTSTDAVRVAGVARRALEDLGYRGFPKTSGAGRPHLRPHRAALDVHGRPPRAIAFGRELERRLPGQVTTNWWKEERGERIFVDYNQNARDRTIASPTAPAEAGRRCRSP
jgi:DNA primase